MCDNNLVKEDIDVKGDKKEALIKLENSEIDNGNNENSKNNNSQQNKGKQKQGKKKKNRKKSISSLNLNQKDEINIENNNNVNKKISKYFKHKKYL